MANPEEEEETSNTRNNKLLLEAITAKMQKMMDERFAAFEERDRTRTDTTQNQGLDDRVRDAATDQYYQRRSDASQGSQRRNRRNRTQDELLRDNLKGLKINIPPFHGKTDPDAYLEWEKKIELVFNVQQYTEHNRVKIAATEFHDYALSWWDQLVTTRRRNQELPVETWSEMKSLMRKRFVPSHYHRELHQKLRKHIQGSRTVEEYYQEMEVLMLRGNIAEDQEATMSRFLGGLNQEIQDRLETEHYMELEEMLHKAILFEQQIKRKRASRSSYSHSSSYTRPGYSKEDKNSFTKDFKPTVYSKPPDSTKITTPAPAEYKGKAKEGVVRSRDVSCFKCHGKGHYASECSNKRVMILLENGEVESADEYTETASEDEQELLPVKGDLLVARRTLSVQNKTQEQEQRENLFHTRCNVRGKVCSLIIDGGSCTNVASETMVKKLGLKTTKHPASYKLQWLNDSGEMSVSKQVLVPISIGKYEDEILCDVLPMDASHILLGRPWQSDRKVIHDGFCNRHTFEYKGKKTTLVPMTPHEVYLDQKKDSPQPKHPNFFAKSSEVKKAYYSNHYMLLFVYKESLLNLSNLTPVIPSEMTNLLQEYSDVFPEETPQGLPPIRGIEHQIDFVPGSSLPNRPAYRTNPVETKELQEQISELMEKAIFVRV